MYGTLRDDLAGRLAEVRKAGLYKTELVMTTPQGAHVDVDGRELLNLCANNYLGLAGHPAMVEAAHEALDRWGYGMASVRFICGTQELHRELEKRLSAFLGAEDTILFSSCFDANGGLFEALLDEQDAIISDQLNHASIIDGARLSFSDERFVARSDPASSVAAASRLLFGSLGLVGPKLHAMVGEDVEGQGPGDPEAAARTNTTASSSESTSSPEHLARRSAARAAAMSPGAARSSSCCASARGRISFRTASHRLSSARACAPSS